MISFSIIFFIPITFLLLRSLSAASNSFYLFFFFLHSYPTLSRSLSMQSPSQFRSSSPPFPLHFLGICSLCQFFICHFLHMTSPCTPHQFILRTFLHSNLHSHFIHFLLSALLIHTILTTLFFRKPGPSLVVSLLVPSSLSIRVFRGNTRADHISFTLM